MLVIVLSVLRLTTSDYHLGVGHCIVCPSYDFWLPLRCWSLYCLSFWLTTSDYHLGVGHCIVCPLTYDFWLPLRCWSLYCLTYVFWLPLRCWSLYCLSVTTSDYHLGVGHCIVCPLTYDFWLPLHCIVCPLTYDFWLPLRCWSLYCLTYVFWLPLRCWSLHCLSVVLITTSSSDYHLGVGHCIVCPYVWRLLITT